MTDIKEIGAGWSLARLDALRSGIKAAGFDGFVIPRWDRHQFEYVIARDERLAWATGFTGSWGMAVVMRDRAAIFVDGRYTEQARREVSSDHFEHMHLYDEPPQTWLARTLKPKEKIGYDPAIATPALVDALADAAKRRNASAAPLWENPVDAAWIDRPDDPLAPAEQYPLERAGASSSEKRAALSRRLSELDLDFLVETQPDNVNWLFNLRGSDLEYCPIAQARAIIHKDGRADLFIDARKVKADSAYEVIADSDAVTRHEPDKLFTVLSERLSENDRVGADPRFAPAGVRDVATNCRAQAIILDDPLTALKARKNGAELENQRAVALRDSAIWCRFAKWLEETVPFRDAAGDPVTELEAENFIDNMRRREPDFYGSSFRTISASDRNGVLAHYAAPSNGGAPITRRSIYLHDSGAQYRNGGTTDTTRTFCFSSQPASVKIRYTSVLKGHIALASQVFPKGTTGHQLDALARAPLWSLGLDYDHGTGHGVGPYLSVHEFPQRLQKAASAAPIEEGMTLTVEPGYYEPGEYGIRIEILYEIAAADKPGFLEMRPMAFVPIQRTMIDIASLTQNEMKWIDTYHCATAERVMPLLSEASEVAWLERATAPLKD